MIDNELGRTMHAQVMPEAMREIADALRVDRRNGSEESREMADAACWFLFARRLGRGRPQPPEQILDPLEQTKHLNNETRGASSATGGGRVMLTVVLAAIAAVCFAGMVVVLLEGVRLAKTAERLKRENKRLRELTGRHPEIPSRARPRLARKRPRS
jgi:hypothetical protein